MTDLKISRHEKSSFCLGSWFQGLVNLTVGNVPLLFILICLALTFTHYKTCHSFLGLNLPPHCFLSLVIMNMFPSEIVDHEAEIRGNVIYAQVINPP